MAALEWDDLRYVLAVAEAGSLAGAARELRAEGWIAVAALGPSGDDTQEARRLGCSHLYLKSGLTAV